MKTRNKATPGMSLEREGENLRGPREQVGKDFFDGSKMGEIKACVHNKGSYEVLFWLLLFIFFRMS